MIQAHPVDDRDSFFLSLGHNRLLPDHSSGAEPSDFEGRKDNVTIEEINQLAKELEDFQAGKGGDIRDISSRSRSLALRANGLSHQEEGLQHQTDDTVFYNDNINAIVAWVSQWGNRSTVTTNVFKYLDDGRFETSVSIRPHDSGCILSGEGNPAIVARLKQKIDELEATLDTSDLE